ncbi:MAG: methionine--tRNA ligase [Planctomycetota bacterium]
MPENLIVTSALPYANGPIHFGHIVGAYLPADIYVRFRRMCGDRVHFVCGTDEHGVAITLKAEQAGESYEAYVDRWHEEISRTLDAVDIEFDAFTGTGHHRNPYHRALSQEFFANLVSNGYVLERTEEQFYSPTLQRFLPDRYVEGTCYKCGFDPARGDECPHCGSWLDAKKLQNPRSTLDGQPPELRPSRHWYLDLAKIRDGWLQEWFEAKRTDWKPNVRNFVEGALGDLRERPITRDLPWGVPMPLSDTDGKVLYVWFDAPIGYLSISKQHFHDRGEPEAFEALWKSPDTKLYHFIGKDNITFHAVVFPAMLWGTQAGWVVPENVPANEFFNLEGQKFNTSKGWYIPADSIAWQVPVDALRYALTTMMPETADSDWSWNEFQARLNGELADNLGNFVSRTLRFAERFLDLTLPPLGPLTPEDEAILQAGRDAAADMTTAFHAFGFRRACQRLMAFSGECNRYFDQQQPWATRKSDPTRCGHCIRICAELVRSLAILAAPIMPTVSRTVLEALGINAAPRFTDAGGVALGDGPRQVAPVPVLFPKLDDEAVARERSRLERMSEDAAKAAQESAGPVPSASPASEEPAESIAPTIEFDTFAAVDLRAGRVVQAEKHPKADRLLVLQVDLGGEVRTIVSGLAEVYQPDELIGRTVTVAANLAPRKLRGIESCGMVLTTEDPAGRPLLLAPDTATPSGARVK